MIGNLNMYFFIYELGDLMLILAFLLPMITDVFTKFCPVSFSLFLHLFCVVRGT
jgi:hypothetical protein